MDALYQKFEQMIDDTSDCRSSRMSFRMGNLVDEERIDFVNGKIRIERNSGLKIIEELDSIHPAISTKPSTKPRVSVIRPPIFNDIPEEESEWNDQQSRMTDMNAPKPNRSIQQILNDYINGSELQVFKRQDLPKIIQENNDFNRTKPTRIDSLNDRLNQTHVFSEAMGDAYTDSQHINDGIMTIESQELPFFPYSIHNFRHNQNQRENSISLFRKMQTNGSEITDNNQVNTDREGSILSIRNPSRNSSINKLKQLPNVGRKRNSHFVRLDLIKNLPGRFGSKQSIHSIQKAPSLVSIREHPGEDNNIETLQPSNHLNVKNIIGQKRNSFYPMDKNQLKGLDLGSIKE